MVYVTMLKTLAPSPSYKSVSCYQQWHARSKTLLQQILHFLTGSAS